MSRGLPEGCIFIPRHMIVARYYGITLAVRVSVRANIQGLGAILGLFWT